MIGYATSTFLPSIHEDEILLAGQILEMPEGYRFEIVESRGYNSDIDPLYETVEVILRISDSGGAIASVPLRMVLQKTGPGGLQQHYVSDVHVHSEHAVDIYFIVIGFFTMSDGWINVTPQIDDARKFSSPSVDAIKIGVEFVPLVGLVWSGVWIMSTGIVVRVVSDRWPTKGIE